MQVKLQKKITARVVQHPNGNAWITTRQNLPDHLEVLAEKTQTFFFVVDLGYDPKRAYPEGASKDQVI